MGLGRSLTLAHTLARQPPCLSISLSVARQLCVADSSTSGCPPDPLGRWAGTRGM